MPSTGLATVFSRCAFNRPMYSVLLQKEFFIAMEALQFGNSVSIQMDELF